MYAHRVSCPNSFQTLHWPCLQHYKGSRDAPARSPEMLLSQTTVCVFSAFVQKFNFSVQFLHHMEQMRIYTTGNHPVFYSPGGSDQEFICSASCSRHELIKLFVSKLRGILPLNMKVPLGYCSLCTNRRILHRV